MISFRHKTIALHAFPYCFGEFTHDADCTTWCAWGERAEIEPDVGFW
jgi:hypothetical protein